MSKEKSCKQRQILQRWFGEREQSAYFYHLTLQRRIVNRIIQFYESRRMISPSKNRSYFEFYSPKFIIALCYQVNLHEFNHSLNKKVQAIFGCYSDIRQRDTISSWRALRSNNVFHCVFATILSHSHPNYLATEPFLRRLSSM